MVEQGHMTRFKKEEIMFQFQRVVVMVSDISEAVFEPLRGWVKDYRPITLQDAISRTLDLQDYVPKNKQPQKTTSLPENKEKLTHLLENKERIIPHREWLNEDT